MSSIISKKFTRTENAPLADYYIMGRFLSVRSFLNYAYQNYSDFSNYLLMHTMNELRIILQKGKSGAGSYRAQV